MFQDSQTAAGISEVESRSIPPDKSEPAPGLIPARIAVLAAPGGSRPVVPPFLLEHHDNKACEWSCEGDVICLFLFCWDWG